MTEEQYKQAAEIKAKLREIDAELKAWDDTRSKHDLGMKWQSQRDHFIELPCRHTPVEAFQAYRQACINALKVKRSELTDAFNAV